VVLLVGHPMNSLDVLLDIGKNSRDFSCEGWYDNVAIREFYQAIHAKVEDVNIAKTLTFGSKRSRCSSRLVP